MSNVVKDFESVRKKLFEHIFVIRLLGFLFHLNMLAHAMDLWGPINLWRVLFGLPISVSPSRHPMNSFLTFKETLKLKYNRLKSVL
jgi:hypothetical protein